MKTAIYIEDGVQQLVLTPENEYEKNIVHAFGKQLNRVQVFEGQFYDCRGGWVRQSAYYPHRISYGEWDRADSSLIMRISTAEQGQDHD